MKQTQDRLLGVLRFPQLMLSAWMALAVCWLCLYTQAGPFRVGTFNAAMNRNDAGELVNNLSTGGDTQAQAVAEIIQRVRPDVLLINEFDHDASGPDGRSEAIRLFQQNYLNVSQHGAEAVRFPYVYVPATNTGVASGFDLNNDGTHNAPVGTREYAEDAFGYGRFPGQYGMVLLSKYPIAVEEIRTFQAFLWNRMPGALLPDDTQTAAPADWYSPQELAVFRLSSKNHCDVPIDVEGTPVHLMIAHPTPPVFDGPEDRNGRRN